MLFALGLLLLLTPFPSFQSTSNERRNPAGSDVTKPNAAFTLPKPKTTAALPKQAVSATLKPNTVNQTVALSPATTKSKPSPSVIQTTPSVAVKSTPTSGTIANKDKHTVTVTQTVSTVSSAANVKVLRDKPATAGALNLQSVSTKPASNHSAKTAKDKLQPVLNHAVTDKSPSASDGKTAKNKPAPPAFQNGHSTSPKTGPASSQSDAKNKQLASVNQAVVDKSSSGSDAKKVAAVPAVSTKNATASANQTASNSKAVSLKEKPAAAQPIQVVVSDGCESGSSKEQELNLRPGVPLVMTHKISLLPGGCSRACETEITALKERVAHLEKEMSSIKDNCRIVWFY